MHKRLAWSWIRCAQPPHNLLASILLSTPRCFCEHRVHIFELCLCINKLYSDLTLSRAYSSTAPHLCQHQLCANHSRIDGEHVAATVYIFMKIYKCKYIQHVASEISRNRSRLTENAPFLCAGTKGHHSRRQTFNRPAITAKERDRTTRTRERTHRIHNIHDSNKFVLCIVCMFALMRSHTGQR